MTPAGGGDARAANLLGALSLAVTDRVTAATAEAAGGSVSSASALSFLLQFGDRASVDRLRRTLGLTPSGAVRLVDRLEASGLVVREPGPDGRTLAVTLTPAGRRAARRVAQARASVLTSMFDALPAADRAAAEPILAGLVDALVRGTDRPDGAGIVCRLCDPRACERPEGRCPAFNAGWERYGSPTERGSSGE